jgi:hypothetical protein
MQFVLMINEDESPYAGEGGAALMEATLAGHMQLAQDLVAAGIAFSGERLKPAATATTVRFDAGAVTLHDGPFAETKEHLGGYYLIEVSDLDAALRYAAMIPTATHGTVEVRPLVVWS